MTAFFDTNILVYTVSTDPRKQRAAQVLGESGLISAQVLNEFTNAARKKLRLDWADIELAVSQFREVFDAILPLTEQTHSAALSFARDHKLAFYDALIVASALEANCDTLYSEDLQSGQMQVLALPCRVLSSGLFKGLVVWQARQENGQTGGIRIGAISEFGEDQFETAPY